MKTRKATRAREKALKTLTQMIRDGEVYQHDPATVGHKVHTAECWKRIEGDKT